MRLLLNWLVNHFLFGSVLMFAAGDIAIAGAGGSDGAADAATATDTTSATVDGETATEEGDSASGTSETAGETGDAETEQATGDELIEGEDGRLIPAKYKDIFKANKELKALYVADKQFKQEFPGGLKEARTLKQTVEQFGGPEGLKEVQSEVSDFRAVDKMFMDGSPELVSRLADANAESFVKLVTAGIEKLATLDKPTYDHTLGRVFFNTLRESEPIHAAYKLMESLKDNPEAQAIKDSLREWYDGFKDLASKVPEKKVDVAQQKLESDRKALAEREQRMHVQSIQQQALPKLVTSIETALAAEMKTRGLKLADIKKNDPDGYKLLLANCMQATKNDALSDRSYLSNFEASLAERNIQKTLKLIEGKHAKIIPAAVSRVFRQLAGVAGGKNVAPKKAGTPVVASAGKKSADGFLFVPEMPNRHAINWDASRGIMLDQKAILKDGKKVTWAKG